MLSGSVVEKIAALSRFGGRPGRLGFARVAAFIGWIVPQLYLGLICHVVAERSSACVGENCLDGTRGLALRPRRLLIVLVSCLRSDGRPWGSPASGLVVSGETPRDHLARHAPPYFRRQEQSPAGGVAEIIMSAGCAGWSFESFPASRRAPFQRGQLREQAGMIQQFNGA